MLSLTHHADVILYKWCKLQVILNWHSCCFKHIRRLEESLLCAKRLVCVRFSHQSVWLLLVPRRGCHDWRQVSHSRNICDWDGLDCLWYIPYVRTSTGWIGLYCCRTTVWLALLLVILTGFARHLRIHVESLQRFQPLLVLKTLHDWIISSNTGCVDSLESRHVCLYDLIVVDSSSHCETWVFLDDIAFLPVKDWSLLWVASHGRKLSECRGYIVISWSCGVVAHCLCVDQRLWLVRSPWSILSRAEVLERALRCSQACSQGHSSDGWRLTNMLIRVNFLSILMTSWLSVTVLK